jgi:hypothetical protein
MSPKILAVFTAAKTPRIFRSLLSWAVVLIICAATQGVCRAGVHDVFLEQLAHGPMTFSITENDEANGQPFIEVRIHGVNWTSQGDILIAESSDDLGTCFNSAGHEACSDILRLTNVNQIVLPSGVIIPEATIFLLSNADFGEGRLQAGLLPGFGGPRPIFTTSVFPEVNTMLPQDTLVGDFPIFHAGFAIRIRVGADDSDSLTIEKLNP